MAIPLGGTPLLPIAGSGVRPLRLYLKVSTMAQSESRGFDAGRLAYAPGRLGVPMVPAEVTPGAVRVGASAAAKFLGVPIATMAMWRRRGRGPAWYMHMGRIAYDVAALQEFAAVKAPA